ncbi:MAG: hypothetical protein JXB07_05715 [Anaerolineae bacterium]|nr:hypothetical protein [Anaerolineae bacterium]
MRPSRRRDIYRCIEEAGCTSDGHCHVDSVLYQPVHRHLPYPFNEGSLFKLFGMHVPDHVAGRIDLDLLDDGPALPDAQTAAHYLDLALWGNNGHYPDDPEEGWMPWLADPRVVAITPFALDGNPVEWGHTNWLMIEEEGQVLGKYPAFDVLAKNTALMGIQRHYFVPVTHL